jgi:MFS family permease
MPQSQQQPAESTYARKQIVLGLVAIFAIYFTVFFFVQTIGIARPRMVADLDGMSLYSWLLSIPSLAAAFVTLLFSKFSDMYGRRIMLLISTVIFLAGTILSAISPTITILIAANTISRFGSGAIAPLCLSVVGDMFPPAQRSKWIGLLNIPSGMVALVGPTLGGWFVDNLSWRHIYWAGAPLIVLCLILVPIGVPAMTQKKIRHKIDVRGSIYVAIASSTAILGLSFAGTTYPWASVQVLALLGISLVFWVIFFRTESGAAEPIMDPQVLHNRAFFTVAGSGLLSFFGLSAMTMYFPLFMQGVQGVTATRSGQILTPLSVLMGFLGVPTGFVLAGSKKYKWMFVAGYGILTIVMGGVVFFNTETTLLWSFLAATLAGVGFGALPTVNTMVVQCCVPKRLLGAAMGAVFFSITMGMAISPAILGSAMNGAYERTLAALLPNELKQVADEATMTTLGNPRVLLSPAALRDLQEKLSHGGSNSRELFARTVDAIRNSLQAGLRSVFLVGAVTMLLAFLLILTVPEIELDTVVQDKKAPEKTAVAEETAV